MLTFKDLAIGDVFYLSPDGTVRPLRLVKISPRKFREPRTGISGSLWTINVGVTRAENVAVHHIDGNPANNELQNLRLVPLHKEGL